MHTSESIGAMNNQAACKTAESLARQLFGRDRFKAELSELIGVTRQTVNNWFANRPPTLVILYMQSELARRDAQSRIGRVRTAFVGLLEKP